MSDSDITRKSGDVAGELTFEEGMKQLEELVAKVESGSLSLERVVTSYEQGVQLVKHLRGLIKGAEEKIRLLHKDMTTTEIESV